MSMEKPLVAASTENNFESPKIPLLLKKANQTRSSILLDPDSFDELVKESNILLDRTLFLKALFDAHNRNLMICMPNGFGTSMLLSMAKAFFEYQPEEERWKSDNFAMFSQKFEGNRQFAIMEDQDFVKEHFGMYHVLHIRMRGISYSGDIKELEQQIGLLISELYEDNLAIFDANPDKLGSYESEEIQNFIENPPSECDWSYVLNTLTNALFKCTKKRVIILVEDYDSFIMNKIEKIKSKEEWRNIVSLLCSFVNVIECAEHVGQLLVCGHHCFHWSTTRMTVLDLAHRNFWHLLTFFGISNRELEELCHSYGFYDVERVRQYYSGFIIKENEYCNNFSIMRFLSDWADFNKARFRPHFRQTGLMQQFTSLFCIERIQHILSNLIKENNNGESPVYLGTALVERPPEWIDGKASVYNGLGHTMNNSLDEKDLRELLTFVNSWDYYLDLSIKVNGLFFKLLLNAGFLCCRGSLLFVPNQEMREKLKYMLDDARRMEQLENAIKPNP